jgi:uncharacterized damage-inducible protein DinB
MSPEDFLVQIGICHHIVRRNVGEITHEESLKQPEPAGNCVNWVLGHLVSARSEFLRGLGAEPVWGEADCRLYERHGQPIKGAREAKPLEEIWKAYDLTQERIRKAVSELTPQQLAQKAPFSPSNNPKETVGSLLTVFAFHDAYHTGQTGVLRRIVGKPAADL